MDEMDFQSSDVHYGQCFVNWENFLLLLFPPGLVFINTPKHTT